MSTITGKTNPNRQTFVQISANEELVHHNASTTLSNIRFYTLEERNKTVAVYTTIPSKIESTAALLNVQQSQAGDIPQLFTLDVFNTLNLSDRASDPVPVFMVSLNPEIKSVLEDPKYAFIDWQFATVKEWFLAAKLLKMFAGTIYTKPIMKTFNGEKVRDVVDLAQFKARDLEKLAEKIAFPDFRNAFVNLIRNNYLEASVLTSQSGVEFSKLINATAGAHADAIGNWTSYAVPFNSLEITLVDVARNYFLSTHHHPIDEIAVMERFNSEYARVSGDSIRTAQAMDRGFRMPKSVAYIADVASSYTSEPCVFELRKMVENAITTDLPVQSLFNKLDALQKTMRVSSTISSNVESLTNFLSTSSFSEILSAIYSNNINVNLYVIDIIDIPSDIMGNPFAFAALMLLMAFFPPYVVKADIRRRINNRVLRALVARLDIDDYKQLCNNLRIKSFPVPPTVSDVSAWDNSELDYAGIVYKGASDLINQRTGKFRPLGSALSVYFRNKPPAMALTPVQLPGSIVESLSMFWPFYSGEHPLEYARDRSFDEFRRKLHMHPNGALLMNSVSDYTRNPNLEPLEHVLAFMNVFYTQPNSTRGGMSQEQINIALKHLSDNAIANLGVIYTHYNAARPSYTTCFAADAYPRYVSPTFKQYITLKSRFFLTGLFYLNPDIEPNPKIDIILYEGMNTIFVIQTFKALFGIVEAQSNLLRDQKITFTQMIEITTALLQVIFNKPDFDPKEYFGYVDYTQWRDLILNNVPPLDDIPVLKCYMKLIDEIIPLIRDKRIPNHVVEEIYIVSGAWSRGNSEILAMNTISKTHLDVKVTIPNIFQFEKLSSEYRIEETTEGPTYTSELDSIYYKYIRRIDPNAQMAPLGQNVQNDGSTPTVKLPAIKVRVRTYVDIDYIKEKGDFEVKSAPAEGMSFADFTERMRHNANDIKNAELITIKHTVILNAVGDGVRPPPLPAYRQQHSLISRLPRLNIIAASEDVTPLMQFKSPATIADEFRSYMLFRRDPYKVIDRNPVKMERVPRLHYS